MTGIYEVIGWAYGFDRGNGEFEAVHFTKMEDEYGIEVAERVSGCPCEMHPVLYLNKQKYVDREGQMLEVVGAV